MPRKSRNKLKSKINSISTKEILSKTDVDSECIVRLKVTVRKGARIESVPLNKLEKLAIKKRLFWKLENEWLILYGI